MGFMMKIFKVFIILVLVVFASACDVKNPVEGVKLSVNAEIEETILNQDVSQPAPAPQKVFENQVISGTSALGKVTGNSNILMAKTASISSSLGSLASGMIGFSGTIENNSGNDVEVELYISTNPSLSSPTGGISLASYNLVDGAEVSVNTSGVPGFIPASYYVYIFATGDPNLNVNVKDLVLTLPAVKDIQTRIGETDEEMILDEILTTDFAGTITNSGSSDVEITVYLASGGFDDGSEDIIASHLIPAGSSYQFSKNTLTFFDPDLYETLVTSYVNNRIPLYSWVKLTSATSIVISVDDLKLKSEVQVSIDLDDD